MKFLIIFILFLSSITYSSTVIKNGRYKNIITNKIFEPYIKKFEQFYNKKVTTPIQLVKLDQTIVGICYYSKISKNIEINQDFWYNSSEEQKENAIFHELGHCELDRLDHINIKDANGCPLSIMYQYIFTNSQIKNCYIPRYDYYINELFER